VSVNRRLRRSGIPHAEGLTFTGGFVGCFDDEHVAGRHAGGFAVMGQQRRNWQLVHGAGLDDQIAGANFQVLLGAVLGQLCVAKLASAPEIRDFLGGRFSSSTALQV
jgi:hypothetical protein